jgi:hypothetical protein
MMESSRAVDDKDHDDGATAITAIDDNGVPYDIDFLYGDGDDGDDHYNEKEEDTSIRPVRTTTATTSTWPSKMMMIMVQRMGGSSSLLQSMRSSFQSSAYSSDATESSVTSGNPTRDGLMRRCDGVVSLDGEEWSNNSGIDVSPSFHKTAAQKQQPDLVVAYLLKIQAAIEMEEQPSCSQSPPPRYHRRFHLVILLDEILLGPHWRKWINLSTLTALLVILVTGGVIGTSWYHHVHRQSNYYDERQLDYAIVKARLGSMMFDVANSVDIEKGPYHQALQWLSTEDDLYQEAIIEFRDNDLLQRFSMAAIYFATSEEEEDAPWIRCGPVSYRCESPASRWLSPYQECQWAGVECDSLDRVVAIKLSKSSCCRCCSCCSCRDFMCCPRYCLLFCSLCLLFLL